MPEKHKEKTYDIGVLVGRFQVPKLHEGHKKLIENVGSKHSKVIILVGVTSTLGTLENPLDYISRIGLFNEYAGPNIVIQPIWDVNCNHVWSENVDHLIRTIAPIGTVRLYGGRDSFIDHYHGKFDTFEYQIITNKEGTHIRMDAGKEVIDNPAFRAGQIYQTQNVYPKVFPTVDMAVLKYEEVKGKIPKNVKVLLGTRKNGDGFSFPGGFVDPTDESFEAAALRELHEEISINTHGIDDVEYVGSTLVDDPRYKNPRERIMTALCKTRLAWGGIDINEEFDNIGWYSLNEPIRMTTAHRPLLNMLLDNLKLEKQDDTKFTPTD